LAFDARGNFGFPFPASWSQEIPDTRNASLAVNRQRVDWWQSVCLAPFRQLVEKVTDALGHLNGINALAENLVRDRALVPDCRRDRSL